MKMQFKLDFKSLDFFEQRLTLTEFLALFPKIHFNKTSVLLIKEFDGLLSYFSSSTTRNLMAIVIFFLLMDNIL